MPSKKPLRDRKSDELAILHVLRGSPDRVFGCAGPNGLEGLSGVPKCLIRGIIDGHPEVEVGEEKTKSSHRFTFKHRKT